MSEAKTMVKKRNFSETAVEEEGVIIGTDFSLDANSSESESREYENFLSAVQDLRKNKDIEGYLLKGKTKATVDLNDSTKIIEYATLTSQALETAAKLSSSFNVGNIETILIEGKNIKTLCISKGQNELGIFMKKDIDDADILETILSQ